MEQENILISLKPEELEMADAAPETGIELKLDWEHVKPDGPLHREGRITEIAKEQEVDTDRIESVHLPPGTSNANGMSVTRGNVGPITDFSFNQMEDTDAYMTTHPPKNFSYEEQTNILTDLCHLTDHEISIENTSVESDWYEPEEIAFFAFLSSQYDSLDELHTTLDSAHLPQGRDVRQDFDVSDGNYYAPDGEIAEAMEDTEIPIASLFDIDYEAAENLEQSLREDEGSLPQDYFTFIGSNLEDRAERYASVSDNLVADESLSGDRYLPLLRTLFMCGDRVKSVHLNDPYSNDVPSDEDIRESDGLGIALDYMDDNSIYTVLEPENDFGRAEIRDWTEMLENY